MICLVIAVLLFAKTKSLRNVAGMAAPAVLFNISEIALFGVPVILNPIFIVPFLVVPILNFLIAYAAMYFDIVPHVVASVEWTTPVLLSGYQATGSWERSSASAYMYCDRRVCISSGLSGCLKLQPRSR